MPRITALFLCRQLSARRDQWARKSRQLLDLVGGALRDRFCWHITNLRHTPPVETETVSHRGSKMYTVTLSKGSEVKVSMVQETRSRSARMPRDERRAQLLAAARQVFVAHGYYGASMDEIAEKAQVSKPVLYQHFPSKRDLYLALLDQQVTELTERMLKALSSTNDNKYRVEATIRAYFDFIAQDDQAHRLIFENDLLNDPEVAARIEEFNAEYASAIAEIIKHDTALSTAEATLLGRALAGMSHVSARYWLETDQELELGVASDLIYRLAWRGISHFPKDTLKREE